MKSGYRVILCAYHRLHVSSHWPGAASHLHLPQRDSALTKAPAFRVADLVWYASPYVVHIATRYSLKT
jgi:hypothetical protein